MRAYRPMALAIAAEFFIPGAEPDDVRQEALMGLLEAVRDHRPPAPFGPFAAVCIRRRIIDAVVAARRGKHRPLTDSIRHGIGDDGDELPAVELLEAPHADPADIVVRLERVRELRAALADLTPIERQALELVTAGVPYAGRPDRKSIDNAVQRARHKLRAAA